MAKKKHVEHGSALRGAVAFQEELAQEALLIRRMERWFDGKDEDEFDLKAMRFKAPIEETGEYLLVVTAWVNGVSMVCFTNGDSVYGCLSAFAKRLLNGSIKWKEDEYAQD